MNETGKQDEYLRIVEQIAVVKRDVINLEKRLVSLTEQHKVAFNRIELEVAQVTDESGKILYKNEDMRRAAMVL